MPKTRRTEGAITPEQFTAALESLGWSQAVFARKAGLDKNTPSRWAGARTPIPAWVSSYLGAMLDLKDLHARYLDPAGPEGQ